jgi:hypothetical protein
MSATERVGNLGYLGLAPETTKGTAVTPTDFVPLYEETLNTNRNLQAQSPIYGNKFEVYKVLPGMRDHTGDITVLAEPNTAVKFFDMLLTRGNVSGGNPYTWPLTVSATNPKSYTLDVSYYDVVVRYYGVEASKIVPVWSNNELQFKISVTGLGNFSGREIAGIAGTSPYVITLKTDYDPAPATGVVVGDVMTLYEASGSTINFTASAVTSTTISTTTNVAAGSAGDMVFLRPQTASFNLLPSFLASNTQWCFGATASAALSAAQTRVEMASTWEIDHNMHDNKGEKRFGGQDAASIIRTTANYAVTVKKFFQDDADVKLFNNLAKNALVIRHYAYSGGNTYELRLTFNNITTDDPLPQVKAKEVNYSTIKYSPSYDSSDAQGMDVKVLNALSSIS